MFGLSIDLRFRLYSPPCDMRKSFDGLCGLVQNDLQSSPNDGTVYIFINKSRNKVKLLQWQSGSFVLYYKRLESGTFDLPNYDKKVTSLSLTYAQLVLLIDGISIGNIRRKKTRNNSSKNMVMAG
ncbi:MAG: IS66 family insertion sequence element accessory protein TnpB [Flavobacteriaceae bacterium]|nr:IS66 family insertion sequence element accessory protein TnpB [Flavobacteriaceae bacterium]